MLAAQPFYLFDIGFQLSVAATLGLVLISDPLNGVANASAPALRNLRLPARFPPLLTKLFGAVREGVLLTLAAQVTTLPLLLVYYEQISLITLLTNALVLPLQPPIMGLGIATSLAGIASRELGTLVALPVFVLLHASIWTVERTAALSWAVLPLGRFGVLWAPAYYGLLLLVLTVRSQPPMRRALLMRWLRPRLRQLMIASGAFAAVALGISVAWSRPAQGALSLWLTGSSALMQTPAGAQLLLVGEGDATGMAAQHLPWWDGELDMLVVPRLDARTQEQAQAVLRTYRAAQVLVPRPAVLTDTVYLFWTQTPPSGVGEVRVADAGAVFDIEPGITGTIALLADDRLGNATLGLRMRVGTRRLDLLPAGELTQTALGAQDDAASPTSDLVFARPSGMNQALLADWPVRWLIWSNDARALTAANLAGREISLFDTIGVGFSISDERLLISPWTIH
jgi:competence protein ComEC